MKLSVKYLDKSKPLKLSRLMFFLLEKGIWYASAELSVRGYDITCTTGYEPPGKLRQRSVVFGSDTADVAELRFHPETKEEADVGIICHNVYKHTYHAICVSSKSFSKGWEKYCREKK